MQKCVCVCVCVDILCHLAHNSTIGGSQCVCVCVCVFHFIWHRIGKSCQTVIKGIIHLDVIDSCHFNCKETLICFSSVSIDLQTAEWCDESA